MRFIIFLFVVNCLINAGLRLIVRLGIPKKYWIKQKSGRKIQDWFLLPFRDEGRKLWVSVHLFLSIAIFISFVLGIVSYFVEQVAVLGVLQIIVCSLSLSGLGCKLFVIPDSPSVSKGRRTENVIFAVIFIFLMLALSIYLSYAFIRGVSV